MEANFITDQTELLEKFFIGYKEDYKHNQRKWSLILDFLNTRCSFFADPDQENTTYSLVLGKRPYSLNFKIMPRMDTSIQDLYEATGCSIDKHSELYYSNKIKYVKITNTYSQESIILKLKRDFEIKNERGTVYCIANMHISETLASSRFNIGFWIDGYQMLEPVSIDIVE